MKMTLTVKQVHLNLQYLRPKWFGGYDAHPE